MNINKLLVGNKKNNDELTEGIKILLLNQMFSYAYQDQEELFDNLIKKDIKKHLLDPYATHFNPEFCSDNGGSIINTAEDYTSFLAFCIYEMPVKYVKKVIGSVSENLKKDLIGKGGKKTIVYYLSAAISRGDADIIECLIENGLASEKSLLEVSLIYRYDVLKNEINAEVKNDINIFHETLYGLDFVNYDCLYGLETNQSKADESPVNMSTLLANNLIIGTQRLLQRCSDYDIKNYQFKEDFLIKISELIMNECSRENLRTSKGIMGSEYKYKNAEFFNKFAKESGQIKRAMLDINESKYLKDFLDPFFNEGILSIDSRIDVKLMDGEKIKVTLHDLFSESIYSNEDISKMRRSYVEKQIENKSETKVDIKHKNKI